MPSRSRSHIVADMAIDQVGAQLTQLGWAWERVQQDYGEDIVVQPTDDEEVESYRIWIQVKGTESIAGYRYGVRGSYAYRFSTNHLRKWRRSTEFVVLVLWDVEDQVGHFALPESSGSNMQLVLSPHESMNVIFEEDDRLTLEAWQQLGWRARLHYYDHRIGRLLFMLSQEDAESGVEFEDSASELLVAAFECLSQLQIFDENMDFCEEFTDELPQIAAHVENTQPLSEEEIREGLTYESMAATIVIIGLVQDRSGAGCPTSLATFLPDFARHVLEGVTTQEWLDEARGYES